MRENKLSKGEKYEKYLKLSLRERVLNSKFTVPEIAKKIGKSTPTLYRYINPDLDTPVNIISVVDILNVLGIDQYDFFFDVDLKIEEDKNSVKS